MRTNTKTQENSNTPALVLGGVILVIVVIVSIASYSANGSL